jgi:hypothetical protein
VTDPQFDIVCGDVMDAVMVGQAVQEGEYDAEVRVHLWLRPGEAFVINRAALTEDLAKL